MPRGKAIEGCLKGSANAERAREQLLALHDLVHLETDETRGGRA
jgi:hypothetical protein